jgi:hypothetical protein
MQSAESFGGAFKLTAAAAKACWRFFKTKVCYPVVDLNRISVLFFKPPELLDRRQGGAAAAVKKKRWDEDEALTNVSSAASVFGNNRCQ